MQALGVLYIGSSYALESDNLLFAGSDIEYNDNYSGTLTVGSTALFAVDNFLFTGSYFPYPAASMMEILSDDVSVDGLGFLELASDDVAVDALLPMQMRSGDEIENVVASISLTINTLQQTDKVAVIKLQSPSV